MTLALLWIDERQNKRNVIYYPEFRCQKQKTQNSTTIETKYLTV